MTNITITSEPIPLTIDEQIDTLSQRLSVIDRQIASLRSQLFDNTVVADIEPVASVSMPLARLFSES